MFGVRKKPATIDEYLATVSSDRRTALRKLRTTIHAVLPDAEECISYSMPAFRHGGYVVAGFLATAKGCSYFPFSGATLSTLSSELTKYSRTKSALHFDPARPPPPALIRRLIETRIAETTTPKARPRHTGDRAKRSVANRRRTSI
jgi:uncharacterized protein YdhG (YjbR/CyaY superfamily)